MISSFQMHRVIVELLYHNEISLKVRLIALDASILLFEYSMMYD